MGLAIKKNQLTGTFISGDKWRVRLSIKPSETKGLFIVFASFLINGAYQKNICQFQFYKKGEYRSTIQTLLINAEQEFGVELLSSCLKIAS